ARAGSRRRVRLVSADHADLAFLSARQIAALVRERKVSPVEITRVYLERIERLDSRLRAYITVVPDKALETARGAETAVMRGQPLGPLHGVPYAVKDQFDTAGVRTTSGSRILEDHVPVEDATTISRLNSAGGILLGKLNLTEFALGGTHARSRTLRGSCRRSLGMTRRIHSRAARRCRSTLARSPTECAGFESESFAS